MLGLFALAAMGGSSLLGAYGSYHAGKSSLESGRNALEAARLNADWEKTSGEIAGRRYMDQARQARTMTAVNLYRQKQYSDSVASSQRAAIAKSGGSMDDPTSQQIFIRTTEDASLDEWLIRYGGSMEAMGYEYAAADARRQGTMGASRAMFEGKMAYAQGKSAYGAGKMGAATSLLSGAANLYTGHKRLNG